MDDIIEPSNTPETAQPARSPRDIAMDQVIASRQASEAADLERHRQDLKEQGLLVEESEGDAPIEMGDPGDDDNLQKELQAEQAAPKAAPKLIEDLDQSMVKIKVDGIEREVPLSELVRTAQKHEAADKRLADATRLLAEAEQRAKQAAAPAAPVQQVPEQNAPDTQQKLRHDRQQKAKEFLDAMFHGEEDKASEILANMLPGDPPPRETVAPQVDAEQITSQVEASLERRSALKQFATAYPEILKDQDLATLADMKLARKIAAGEAFQTALMNVGEELYLKSGHKKPEAAETQVQSATPTQAEKVERKKAADPVRGRNASAATTQDAPLSPSDVIKQMQEQRLRGRWNGSQARH